MNHENHSPSLPPPADPELEARIVAWVAGEAAAAEIAALEHLVAVRPELAVFKRRIEAVHGLVAEAARPDREPLRLSPERRVKLLATLSAPVVGGAGGADAGRTAAQPKPVASAKPSAVRLPRPTERPWWRNEWFYSAAACVVISIGGFWMLGTVPKEYDLVSHVSQAPNARFESVRYKAAEESDEEGMSNVGDFEVTTVIKPAPPVAAQMSWSAPKEAAAPRFAPKPSISIGAIGGEKRKSGAIGGLNAPAQLAREADLALSARGYKGTADDGSTGVLEPFEVSETATTGYAATTTLAGTRLRTELHDVGSAVSVVTKGFMKDSSGGGAAGNFAGKSDAAHPRDNFLAKRKAERPMPMATSASIPPASVAPSAVGEEKEEVVVLSPFSVASSSDSGFLKANRPAKLAKRPAPAATTAGMGPGPLVGNQVLLPDRSDQTDRSDRTIATGKADDKPLPKAKPAAAPPTADETNAAQEPVSTFSLHVSDASFKLALAALNSGSLPEPASIRPEEFYNAFDYGDPAPAAGEQVSCRVEQSAHPFAQQRNLVRLAVRVPATGRGGGTPLNLTVLLDTSGSMERPDRRAAVRAALATLVGLLGPADHVTLVGFARQPRLLAEALDGNHANQTLDLLDRTPAEGGTNLEEALKLGSELARRHFTATAQNRIVLLTDGAANLGNADPERLAAAVESLRSQRIAFDACGVGLEGVDDDVLEALTRKGDGRYYVLNSPEAADAGFARQLAGAFRPAAENVKLQVRFNPARVGRYRLVGFEKHRLREEDFRNDAVDAAEISSEEAAVAVYEIEALPQGEGELGEVFVRFRDPASRTMVERSWTLPFEPRAAAFDRASPSLQLAGTAAALAEKLRGGPAGDRVDLDALAPIVNAQRARRPDDKRIQDLVTLFEQLRRMKK